MDLAEGGSHQQSPGGWFWGLTASQGRETPRVGLGTNLQGKRTRG